MNKKGFMGRSVTVAADLSRDEQHYLYKKTRELKRLIKLRKNLGEYILRDPALAIYLAFLEPSTRTRESFVNAAKFHRVKLNIFDADSSSFTKNESYADTFKMLAGYSPRSIFVLRTKLEGVCRWLDISLEEYSRRQNRPKPCFINGGDGKHEHPTQEYLDEFTLLEFNKWDTESFHIALVGDLFHGRTVHSKADGLGIFRNVEVDLIAPPELQLPQYYAEKMRQNGFKVRAFNSIDEYLKQPSIARAWYFTRPQLERMGQDVLERAAKLVSSITFRKEHLAYLPSNTKFFHPLPRSRENPTIPYYLDATPLNGWEQQAINGFYIRVVLLAMLGGKLGNDFKGRSNQPSPDEGAYYEEVPPISSKKPDYKIGIKPISEGIVIDHICKGRSEAEIWNQISRINRTMHLFCVGSQGVFPSEKDGRLKGIISIPNHPGFDKTGIRKLASVSPGSTLNVISGGKIQHKYRLHTPPSVFGFYEASCKNPDCISHPSHKEGVPPHFVRSGNSTYVCLYCERQHSFGEVWD